MGYTLAGVKLTNPVYGWQELADTQYGTETSISRPEVLTPGRHGRLAGMPETYATPALRITVGTPKAHLEKLRALLAAGGTMSRDHLPGSATVETVSVGEPVLVSTGFFTVTAIFEIPGGFWRGPLTVWGQEAGVSMVMAAPGGSAPPSQLQALIPSGWKNPSINDFTATSFMGWTGTVPSGKKLRMDTTTGRAYLVSGWDDDGDEVDPATLTFGSGPAFFTVTPEFDKELGLSSLIFIVSENSTETGALIRGRASYLG